MAGPDESKATDGYGSDEGGDQKPTADEGQVIIHPTMPKYGDKIALPPGKSTHEEPAPSADEGQVIIHRTMPKYGDKIVLPPGKSTHEEPAPYIGPGWICRVNKRKTPGGTGPKADRFWFSADRSIKLRSIAEVERYLKGTSADDGSGANKATGDDEKEEGRPVRKKARTRSYDNDFVYDDDMGIDDKNSINNGNHGDDNDAGREENDEADEGPDPINPLINSAVALSRGKIHFATAPQAAVGALLNSKNEDGSSKTFAYSWDSILGFDLDSADVVVGTAAMAQYLKSMQEKELGSAVEAASTTTATPTQILEMIRSLRPRTCRPPNGSGVVEVVHNKPSENALWYGKEEAGKGKEGEGASASVAVLDQYAKEVDRKIHQKILAGNDDSQEKAGSEIVEGDLIVPYSALSRLYEGMCKQDVSSSAVGGESTFRRECRYITAPKVVEALRNYENTTVELDQRERDAMEVGRELGLLGENGKDG